MTARFRRLALMTVVPTALDIALFVYLRYRVGWNLVAADLVAIAVASVVSYGVHRLVTFRSDPYVRWVRMPLTFVAVAGLAGMADLAVLRGLYAAHEFTAVSSLTAAKIGAVTIGALVRLGLYRAVLLTVVRRSIHERASRGVAPGVLRATVVIPALNEADRIASTIREVREALQSIERDGGLEVVIVDDGSSDDTADVALATGADQVVVLPENCGKGAAVRAGMSAARGRTIAFTDADLSYSADQIASVITEIEAGWDVAVGSRRHPAAETMRGPGALRNIGSRAINLVTTGVLLSHPRDTQCGLKAFRSDVAALVFGLARLDGFAFDIEVLHLVERHGLSLVEVPVRLRAAEQSTVRAIPDGLGLLRDLWRIRRWSASGAYEVPPGAWPMQPADEATSGRSLG